MTLSWEPEGLTCVRILPASPSGGYPDHIFRLEIVWETEEESGRFID